MEQEAYFDRFEIDEPKEKYVYFFFIPATGLHINDLIPNFHLFCLWTFLILLRKFFECGRHFVSFVTLSWYAIKVITYVDS